MIHVYQQSTTKKIGRGDTINNLDGNPDQITVGSRLAAIIRTPPNRETAELVKKIVKSRLI